MLRIGKQQREQDQSESYQDKRSTASYSTPHAYSSYQTPDAPARPATPTTATPRAMTESEALAHEIKDGTLSGFVGSTASVAGEATFNGMLRIDGHLSGRVSSASGTLIVGANGRVDADIEVAIATIHGTVKGDVVASQRIELGRAARVEGNIQTPSLVIEQGAIFEGNCRMAQQRAAVEAEKAVVDTTGMEPISAESESESADFESISEVAS
jgi:cytoskeletal protein CcmA (bactofilin family)